VSDLLAAYAARLTGIDPLLGVPADPPAGEPIAAGAARGWARVVDVDPAEASAAWSKLRTYVLAPRWAGDPADLDTLVAAWRSWLVAHGARDAGPETQTSITWPSRDVEAARVFYRHGLMPATTVAVRPRGRLSSLAGPPAGVTVRPATPADVDAVVSLGMDELRFDAGLSPTTDRPGQEEARRRLVARDLDEPSPWAWVAERDGSPVGVLVAEKPEAAGWIGGMTSLAPAAYVALLSVRPGERGGGVGTALAAVAQRTFDETGLPVSLLHYGSFNPLSGPFWSRHGYRPLWTVWSTEPATALR
jgi:GNAT superfamily N-acetyltransferase